MPPSPVPANIKKFLNVLGIKMSFISGGAKVPGHAAVRKAFRNNLKKVHPDKGGVHMTATFQELSEAAREVADYIDKNPEMVEEEAEADTDNPEEQDNLKELFKIFATSSGLKYNKDSVVFNIEKDQVDEWMSKFTEYFDNKRELVTTADATMFKNDAWVLSGKEEEEEEKVGSVAVTVWPDITNPKVMVQGTMYSPFVATVLPAIAMAVHKKAPLQITDKSEVKVKETVLKGGLP